ncbi:hypothetical protein [Paenibacillus borealis]|uniref:Lipoprotein n=1 Tax=Paenibacillus borealis TaxID=160799 RepID=A0A089LI90_PAEBO|nr:hypothetical protein [Paenibacillus borealis]AIQ59820.1 hypothetical protein PBOR_24850 [Paenibacillus borealis]
MSAKWMWRLLLSFVVIISASGCSSVLGPGDNGGSAGSTGLSLSILVGEREMAGTSGRLLSEAYTEGNSIIELLRKSGIVTFAADGYSILEVNKVALSQDMVWEVQVNGKKLTDWNSKIETGAAIIFAAKPAAAGAVFQPVLLTVNGGSEQPELTHSHVLSYTEDMSVRGLMKNSGMIKLAEDNKTVLAVMDYTPLSSEEWKLKVNDKGLLGNGVDMKLRPQDKLEISLVLK